MTAIHHLNCGLLHVPPGPEAACHCVLLAGPKGLTLVDTGIGLRDVANPSARIPPEVIAAAGFQFHEELTAVRQIEKLGLRPADVTDIVLTHADPDHAGGLADFPAAAVHLSELERKQIESGHARYCPPQFSHGPKWVPYSDFSRDWFGLDAAPVPTPAGELLLVSLPGHTFGHCGVAIPDGDCWQLHVGDAYYLRVELDTDDHPVSRLASLRADDDARRRASLAALRRLHRDHPADVSLFGYHDFTEFPASR